MGEAAVSAVGVGVGAEPTDLKMSFNSASVGGESPVIRIVRPESGSVTLKVGIEFFIEFQW